MGTKIDLADLVNRPAMCRRTAGRLQRAVALETAATRGIGGFRQYGLYFLTFWLYGIVQPTRARALRDGYFSARYWDDVADRDRPLPRGYATIKEFLDNKSRLVMQLYDPRRPAPLPGDEADAMLAGLYLSSQVLGISLLDETLAIFDSLKLDAERGSSRRVLTEEELRRSFRNLDYACVDGAFKIAGEPYRAELLQNLSNAVRIWYSLRDFPKDLKAGIINISSQDMASYGINLDMCKGDTPELLAYRPFHEWYADQAALGHSYLAAAKQTIKETPFKFLTRLALNFNFVSPAERFFSKTANI